LQGRQICNCIKGHTQERSLMHVPGVGDVFPMFLHLEGTVEHIVENDHIRVTCVATTLHKQVHCITTRKHVVGGRGSV